MMACLHRSEPHDKRWMQRRTLRKYFVQHGHHSTSTRAATSDVCLCMVTVCMARAFLDWKARSQWGQPCCAPS
eukprot:14314420-Alexandrium_andersonii.AAC.1